MSVIGGVDARRTKRERRQDEELSLEEHIALRRAKLVQQRNEAPALRLRASELRRLNLADTCRWRTRLRLDCAREAQALDEEASVRESMVREHEFESTAAGYLRMHRRKVESAREPACALRKSDTIEAYVRHTDLTLQRRAAIVDEYLVQIDHALPKVAMAARDECPRCNVRLLLCTTRSVLTCPECGYAMTYLDATSSSVSFDDVVEYCQYSYKRANHFAMWIALCQGKETHRVPDEILEKVMRELYTDRVRDAREVTSRRVRDILRRLRLRKAYDHVAQITARISGIPPPRISTETEERLRGMFMKMQPAFEKHAPKTRTNFLSYSYVLYRCFQIMGLHHMLDGLSLLKGRDKLELNDAIFRRMCEDLGWPVFDLPASGA